MRSLFAGRMPLGNTILCIYFFVLHSFKTPLFYYFKVCLSLFIVGGRNKSIMSFASILRRGNTCVGMSMTCMLSLLPKKTLLYEHSQRNGVIC